MTTANTERRHGLRNELTPSVPPSRFEIGNRAFRIAWLTVTSVFGYAILSIGASVREALCGR